MILFDHVFFNLIFIYNLIEIIFKKLIMTKRTLSNKSRKAILRLSGFRARMSTLNGRRTIKNRRKKHRKNLAISN